MAKEIIKGNKKHYICKECGLKYRDRGIAQKCEDYCKKHHQCSLEIIKYAIK